MKVLVFGGRDYNDRIAIFAELDKLKPSLVIHGGCRGADRIAGAWARLAGVREQVFFADWETHGNAAGPIRNQRMIDEGRPDIALGFPGGNGTADMARRARAAGVEVREYRERDSESHREEKACGY